ncbi:MAG: 4a-hydroxytetrahydrobiopterin dehydratase [Hydrogenophaga sp.]
MNIPTPRPQALSATAVVTQLTQLNGNAAIGWRLIDGALEKRFVFPNFHETMAFANAVAWIAHREDHHPELALNHGHGTVRWRTYDVGGITSLDFACAAAVDALLATPRPHP